MNQPSPADTKPVSEPANPSAPHAAPPMPGSLYRSAQADALSKLLGQLPASIKAAGSNVAARYQQLSTTQKVVGGALLLLVGRRLLRGTRPAGKKGRRKAEADTLHELLYFVNDRVAGYQKAVEESQAAEHRSYYQRLVGQSQQFAGTLNDYLPQLGGRPVSSTTLKGKLYRRFMAATATVTGHSDQAILASNIHGEQWALKAYQEALGKQTLRGSLHQEVARQYHKSQQTYQALKQLAAAA